MTLSAGSNTPPAECIYPFCGLRKRTRPGNGGARVTPRPPSDPRPVPSAPRTPSESGGWVGACILLGLLAAVTVTFLLWLGALSASARGGRPGLGYPAYPAVGFIRSR
jgi:hypothetical protein